MPADPHKLTDFLDALEDGGEALAEMVNLRLEDPPPLPCPDAEPAEPVCDDWIVVEWSNEDLDPDVIEMHDAPFLPLSHRRYTKWTSPDGSTWDLPLLFTLIAADPLQGHALYAVEITE